MRAQSLATRGTGFGLGLRTPHYPDYLAARQALDWLEIITDNFLVEGGKPLVMLDTFRRDYPMAMHGVAMSIGAPGEVDRAYLDKVKALAQRIEPLWVSDHLCWVGTGPEQLHDLYPLPYTDEAARHVIAQIRRVQDILGRRLVLENVSSYIDYASSSASEWQFLAHVAQEADCLLLVDVNNIYVSSVNHGFDPMQYLRAMPSHRVQQIHLAGHSNNGNHIVDTHDHPVAPAVWELYAQACRLYGAVPTMIERDAHIPPLAELLAELEQSRQVARAHTVHYVADPSSASATSGAAMADTPEATPLTQVQEALVRHVLDRTASDTAAPVVETLVRDSQGFDRKQRLGIYHHAYRARLSEALADSFAKTCLYMGSDTFDEHAAEFAVAHPPTTRNLGRYGETFPAWLAQRYPHNPELQELSQLDWDLRACFDASDASALSAEQAQAVTDNSWLTRPAPLHPTLRLRANTTNVVQLWNAIDADQPVPAPEPLALPGQLMVWRKGLQPHFQTVSPVQGALLAALLAGQSIAQACDEPSVAIPNPAELSVWIRGWLDNGLLAR